jgi:hypothetical protein
VIAKLFVSFGAPDHSKAGETFSPPQPNPLKTCLLGSGFLVSKDVVFNVKAARALWVHSRKAKKKNFS